MTLIIHPPQDGDRGHAPISPSASSRWLVCPFSLTLPGEPGHPTEPSKSSKAAELGTIQHSAIEDAIRTGDIETPARIVRSLSIDDVLIRRAWADFHSVISRYDIGQVWLETTVEPFAEIGDLFFGTSDCIAISRDGKTLVILDYKFGKWDVAAELNSQLLIYAMGAHRYVAARGFYPENTVVAISQPMSSVSLKIWGVDPAMVADFAGYLSATLCARFDWSLRTSDFTWTRDIAHAQVLDLPHHDAPVPGDHCNFCPRKTDCPARGSAAAFDGFDGAEIDFD